jgi:hypothetical protein
MTSLAYWKVITGTGTAAILLVAAMGFNLFTPAVEAQNVTAASSNHPAFSTFCPPKMVQHWDKIWLDFRIVGTVTIVDASGQAVTRDVDVEKTNVDIKVRDDPTKIADLEEKIKAFLLKNPKIEPGNEPLLPIPDNVDPDNVKIDVEIGISIHDVEYAIVCTPELAQLQVAPAPPGKP